MSAICRQCIVGTKQKIFSNFLKTNKQTHINVNPSCIVLVRYRKPRHLGRAPSKDPSYFAKKYPTNKDVKSNIFLYRNYNAVLKSLVAAFQEEILEKEQMQGRTFTDEKEWDEVAHHQKCLLYNKEENERLLAARMKRIHTELVRVKGKERTSQKEINQQEEAEKQERRKEVERTILESKEWLTLDNLESKITEAVDNPINFNFAVDESGMIVKRTAQTL